MSAVSTCFAKAPKRASGRVRGREEAIAAVEAGVALLVGDDEEQSDTAIVLNFLRELAQAGDDETHSVAEAFAAGE